MSAENDAYFNRLIKPEFDADICRENKRQEFSARRYVLDRINKKLEEENAKEHPDPKVISKLNREWENATCD